MGAISSTHLEFGNQISRMSNEVCFQSNFKMEFIMSKIENTGKLDY